MVLNTIMTKRSFKKFFSDKRPKHITADVAIEALNRMGYNAHDSSLGITAKREIGYGARYHIQIETSQLDGMIHPNCLITIHKDCELSEGRLHKTKYRGADLTKERDKFFKNLKALSYSLLEKQKS